MREIPPKRFNSSTIEGNIGFPQLQQADEESVAVPESVPVTSSVLGTLSLQFILALPISTVPIGAIQEKLLHQEKQRQQQQQLLQSQMTVSTGPPFPMENYTGLPRSSPTNSGIMSSVHEAILIQMQQSINQLLDLTQSHGKRLKRIEQRLGINIASDMSLLSSEVPDFERSSSASSSSSSSSSSLIIGGSTSNVPVFVGQTTIQPFTLPVRSETSVFTETDNDLLRPFQAMIKLLQLDVLFA